VTIPWVQFDSINFLEVTHGTWGVLQVETEDKGGPYLRCHSASAGSKTTYSSTHVKVTVGKPYCQLALRRRCRNGVWGSI
jgi:hypothetical protein